MTDSAKLNRGKEMANSAIRLIADDNGMNFNELIKDSVKKGYWSNLEQQFNKMIDLGYFPDYKDEDLESEFSQLIIGDEDSAQEIISKQSKDVQSCWTKIQSILDKIFYL